MSNTQQVIVVNLSWDRKLVLPFDENGVTIANMLKDGLFHEGYDTTVFNPSSYEVTIEVVQMDLSEQGRIAQLEAALSSARQSLGKRISELSEANQLLVQSGITSGQRVAELEKAILESTEPVKSGAKSYENQRTQTRKRNKALREANENLAYLRSHLNNG